MEDQIIGRMPPPCRDTRRLYTEPFITRSCVVVGRCFWVCYFCRLLVLFPSKLRYHFHLGLWWSLDGTPCYESVPRVYSRSTNVVSFGLPEPLRLPQTPHCEDCSIDFVGRPILEITFEGTFDPACVGWRSQSSRERGYDEREDLMHLEKSFIVVHRHDFDFDGVQRERLMP